MDIERLQRQICNIITSIGGRIKWKKELGLPARIFYFLSRKEPVINIEALFLGERFAVVIGNQKGRQNAGRFNSSGYRIFVCNSLGEFKKQFDAFKQEKLSPS